MLKCSNPRWIDSFGEVKTDWSITVHLWYKYFITTIQFLMTNSLKSTITWYNYSLFKPIYLIFINHLIIALPYNFSPIFKIMRLMCFDLVFIFYRMRRSKLYYSRYFCSFFLLGKVDKLNTIGIIIWIIL